jgi:molecular chaperone GrpE (heat shock protein)
MGSGGISIRNFETIFKKYCYYIENVPKAESFPTESIDEKLLFLEGVTEVYDKLGKHVTSHMIKAFNKVSDEVFNELKKRISIDNSSATNEN